MNAASIGEVEYAPQTRLDITPSFPVEYDPSGKVASFEIVDSKEVVVFRFKSGVDSNLAINGQLIELRMTPSAVSVEENVGATFESVIESLGEYANFNLDMENGEFVDYRFQGRLRVIRKHGVPK